MTKCVIEVQGLDQSGVFGEQYIEMRREGKLEYSFSGTGEWYEGIVVSWDRSDRGVADYVLAENIEDYKGEEEGCVAVVSEKEWCEKPKGYYLEWFKRGGRVALVEVRDSVSGEEGIKGNGYPYDRVTFAEGNVLDISCLIGEEMRLGWNYSVDSRKKEEKRGKGIRYYDGYLVGGEVEVRYREGKEKKGEERENFNSVSATRSVRERVFANAMTVEEIRIRVGESKKSGKRAKSSKSGNAKQGNSLQQRLRKALKSKKTETELEEPKKTKKSKKEQMKSLANLF